MTNACPASHPGADPKYFGIPHTSPGCVRKASIYNQNSRVQNTTLPGLSHDLLLAMNTTRIRGLPQFSLDLQSIKVFDRTRCTRASQCHMALVILETIVWNNAVQGHDDTVCRDPPCSEQSRHVAVSSHLLNHEILNMANSGFFPRP